MAPSLEQQREDFKRRRFIAMPLAGTLVWFAIGVASLFLNTQQSSLALFIGTGSIFYLGMFISRFTGENFFDKTRPPNTFDRMFLSTVAMSLLVFAIAIPFFLVDNTSLPLTVGILAGLMWLPLSWAIEHWIGIFHAVSRTLLIVAAWYLWPEWRFATISAIIVVIYLITLVVLERRWRRIHG